MKQVITIWVVVLFSFGLKGQDTVYHYTLGTSGKESAVAIFEHHAGFHLFGSTGFVGSGQSDIYVVSLNSDFEVDSFITHGSYTNENLIAVEKAFNGNYYLASSNYDIYSGSGYDVRIDVLDSSLNLIETTVFENSGTESPVDIKSDSTHIYLLDETEGSKKTYRLRILNYNLQSTQDVEFESDDLIELSSLYINNDIFLIGSITHEADTQSQALVLRYSTSGEKISQHEYGKSRDEIGSNLIQDSDTSYILTGSSNSYKDVDFDGYVVKLDLEFDTIWEKTHGYNPNIENRDDFGVNSIPSRNKEVLMGLTTSTYGQGKKDFIVYKLDTNGKYITGYSFGFKEDEELISIQQISDTSLLMLGTTASKGIGLQDIFLVRVHELKPNLPRVYFTIPDTISPINQNIGIQKPESNSNISLAYINNEVVFRIEDPTEFLHYELYEISGRLIEKGNGVSNELRFNQDNLSINLIVFTRLDGTVEVHKFVN